MHLTCYLQFGSAFNYKFKVALFWVGGMNCAVFFYAFMCSLYLSLRHQLEIKEHKRQLLLHSLSEKRLCFTYHSDTIANMCSETSPVVVLCVVDTTERCCIQPHVCTEFALPWVLPGFPANGCSHLEHSCVWDVGFINSKFEWWLRTEIY